MTEQKKTIEICIPRKYAEKIENEGYSLHGTMLRDKKKRIVCNLKSLEISDDHCFSQSIFVMLNKTYIYPCTFINDLLMNVITSHKESYINITGNINNLHEKLDADIYSLIASFYECYSSLKEGSQLTSERHTFEKGVEASSKIASSLDIYINEYIDKTTVALNNNSQQLLYSEFKSRYPIDSHLIIQSKFMNYTESKAHFFTYSLIDILNKINILSLIYDKKPHPRYKDNLMLIRGKIESLINRFISGLGVEDNFYNMYYGNNGIGKFYETDINKILQYDKSRTINDLIRSNFNNCYYNYDDNRAKSIDVTIKTIEDIDILLKRLDEFQELDFSTLAEMFDMKKIEFN